MKIYIFPNLSKINCQEYTASACKILNKNGAMLFMSDCYNEAFGNIPYISFGNEDDCIKKCDIIVAVGGDGTILKCSMKSSCFEKPILGINCGRLGFMASLEHSQLELLNNLFTNNYRVSRRMMLEIEINNSVYRALNDMVISKSDDCKIADFTVSKNGHIISSLRADGVIFSTATGATAYSMSAGGPIVEPEMECIEFTQICAHSLFARSMILSADSVMTVNCHTNGDAHAYLHIDGNRVCRLSEGDVVKVCKSRYFVDIIDISGDSFFTQVNSKLMQPLKDTAEGL